MLSLVTTLALLIAPPAVSSPPASAASDTTGTTWQIDVTHSELLFRVRHLVSRVTGTFTDWDGTITGDPADWSRGAVTVRIRTRSITTNHQRRDTHLRSDDFFATDSFPEMTFVSTGVSFQGDSVTLNGNLSIRGRTRPVVLTALPERIRRKTAVGAAADRFYRRGKRTWWFSLFFNTFPIVRGGGSATLDYARELLGRGWSVVIFPEGTRSQTGDVSRFRHGVAILAMQANVPVVPVHIEGLRNVMPKGERTPRPAEVSVRIGAPVWVDDALTVPEATDRLQAALLSLAPVDAVVATAA